MTEPGLALVLGFIGLDPVHKDNSRAMLNDLITAFKKTVKRPQVLFILDAEGWSTTMAELCDYAMTSGYGIGLVGPDKYIDDKGQDRINAADGNIYRLKDDVDIASGMVNALSVWPNAHLIIIGDPEEDDDVYNAVELAVAKKLDVRSLLHGMDKVKLETTEEEEETPVARGRHRDDDEDYDEDDVAEGEVEDADVGYDDEDLGSDDEDDAVEAEILEDEDEDEAEDEVSARRRKRREERAAAADDEGDDEEPDLDDLEAVAEADEDDEEEVSDQSDEDDDQEDEEPVAKTTTKWNKVKLERLYDEDPAQFKAVGISYGVMPGRGIKSFMTIDRILEAIKEGVEPEEIPVPVKKAARTTKKVAKKVTATVPSKKGPPKPQKAAPVKKEAPAKKPAPAPAKAAVAKRTAPVRTAAPAASNGHVDKALLKAAVTSAKKFVDLAESLL